MQRYTIEELFELKPSETLPVDFDAAEFKAIIEKVKQVQQLREEEFLASGGHFGRRRSSHHFHTRPKVKHNKPKVTTDEDGWSTFEPKVAGEGEDDEGVAVPERSNSNPIIAQETMKVKPNNKNIGSSRPADTRDIIADKQTLSFNAFAALESDSEDED